MSLNPHDDLEIPAFLRRPWLTLPPNTQFLTEEPMTIGQNTVKGEQLRSFVERIENLREQKKALTQDEAVVMQEAKAAGLTPAGIRHCLKIRAMKPHDRQETEALNGMYLHALGLDDEPPLFRAMAAMEVDTSIHENVIEALKRFVPQEGDFITRVGKQAKCLWRDKDGNVHVEDWQEARLPAKNTAGTTVTKTQKAEAPDCTEDEAEQLGAEACKRNEPIVSNPFPFGDPRRPRFDKGWCAQSGSAGMGPEEPEDDDESDGEDD